MGLKVLGLQGLRHEGYLVGVLIRGSYYLGVYIRGPLLSQTPPLNSAKPSIISLG